MKSGWVKVGTVSVDTGTLSIVDSGMMHATDWPQFTRRMERAEAENKGKGAQDTMPDREGIVITRTGDGDGRYPVEVKRDEDGCIVEVRIRFR